MGKQISYVMVMVNVVFDENYEHYCYFILMKQINFRMYINLNKIKHTSVYSLYDLYYSLYNIMIGW